MEHDAKSLLSLPASAIMHDTQSDRTGVSPRLPFLCVENELSVQKYSLKFETLLKARVQLESLKHAVV